VLRYLCDLPRHVHFPGKSSAVNDVRDVDDRHACLIRFLRATSFQPRRTLQYVRHAYPMLAPPSSHSRRSSARRPLLMLRALVGACRSSCRRDLVAQHPSHCPHG